MRTKCRATEGVVLATEEVVATEVEIEEVVATEAEIEEAAVAAEEDNKKLIKSIKQQERATVAKSINNILCYLQKDQSIEKRRKAA